MAETPPNLLTPDILHLTQWQVFWCLSWGLNFPPSIYTRKTPWLSEGSAGARPCKTHIQRLLEHHSFISEWRNIHCFVLGCDASPVCGCGVFWVSTERPDRQLSPPKRGCRNSALKITFYTACRFLEINFLHKNHLPGKRYMVTTSWKMHECSN